MNELWEIIKTATPGIIAAVVTLTPLIICTIKILRAIGDNKNVNTRMDAVDAKLDGVIDLITLDYNNRKSVTPLEKQAMTELAQKVRNGGRIDSAMAVAKVENTVNKLAATVDTLLNNRVELTVNETITEPVALPEGFIDPGKIA